MITESRSSVSSSSLIDGRGDVRIDIRSDGRGDIRIDSRRTDGRSDMALVDGRVIDASGRAERTLEIAGRGGGSGFEVMRSSGSAFSSYASNHYNGAAVAAAAAAAAAGVKDGRKTSKSGLFHLLYRARRYYFSFVAARCISFHLLF